MEGSLEQLYGTITGDVEGADAARDELEADIEGVLLSNINLRLIRDQLPEPWVKLLCCVC